MINSHDSIADRAFRYLSMKGSDVSSPVSGRLKTISKIRQKDLRRKLDYFKKVCEKKIVPLLCASRSFESERYHYT